MVRVNVAIGVRFCICASVSPSSFDKDVVQNFVSRSKEGAYLVVCFVIKICGFVTILLLEPTVCGYK